MMEEGWELCKENVMPVKSGRSTKGLSVAKLGGGLKPKMEDEEAVFERLLQESAADSDPLDAYVKYFKWIRDTFPSDLQKTLSFLERCTCDFSHDIKYKNDIRFVKLWIEYADCVRTPGEIFSYMQSNKIGTKLSIFWIAWAFVAEKLENFKLTDQIFQKGILKQAEPKDVLQKRYQQFQRRLARHYLNLAEKAQNAPPEDEDKPQRGALSSLSGSRVKRMDRVSATISQQSHGLYNQQGISANERIEMTNMNSNIPQTSVFTVFSDENVNAAGPSMVDNENSEWKQLPKESISKKENSVHVSRWNDAPLIPSSSGRTTSAMGPSTDFCPISIFADDDADVEIKTENANEEGYESIVKNSHSSCLHDHIKGHSEIISKDPLRRHRETKTAKITKKDTAEPTQLKRESMNTSTNVAPLPSSAPVSYQQEQNGGMGDIVFGDQEDMTINTKIAKLDIDSMFCSPQASRVENSFNGTSFSILDESLLLLPTCDLGDDIKNLSGIAKAKEGRDT
jgi:hypothetical protein